MVTKEQALKERYFHVDGLCKRWVGPRGGVVERSVTWRRNGMTKTWKTRPTHFRIPIKHGLYDYWEITHENANEFHVESECPLLQHALEA